MMRCTMIGAIRLAMLSGGLACALGAQSVDGGRAGFARARQTESPAAPASVVPGASAPSDSVLGLSATPRLRPYAPLISAVVPGGGQFLLGNGRALVYAVIEVIGWWNYQKNRNDVGQQTDAFKAIASGVARSAFTAHPQDGPWAYYEQMRDREESGVYSTTETGPVVPPTDTRTYNGYKWQLALQNNATCAAALAEYEQIAIKPEFQWSWKDHTLEYDIFKRTTELRNDANQRASNYLLAIGANHVLSMIDAFATIRLRVEPGANGGTSIGASLGW